MGFGFTPLGLALTTAVPSEDKTVTPLSARIRCGHTGRLEENGLEAILCKVFRIISTAKAQVAVPKISHRPQENTIQL